MYIGSSNKFKYEFNTNKIIDIKLNDLYHFCENENQIYKIFITMNKINKNYNMLFNDRNQDSIVEINVMKKNQTN